MCTQSTLVAVRLTNLNVMEILLFTWYTSVGGIMVSIAAFQAVDPGSIPGRRILFLAFPSLRTDVWKSSKFLWCISFHPGGSGARVQLQVLESILSSHIQPL